MKILLALTVSIILCLLPLIPTTGTTTYTTQVPESYTVTESFTTYIPRTGERAIWNESPAHTEWRTSIKDSIESARPPAGRSEYFSIEHYTYMKPVTRKRQVTKVRLVDKTISIEVAKHISTLQWLVETGGQSTQHGN